MGPILLLLHVWVAEPLRAIAGIGGLVCLVWALLSLPDDRAAGSTCDGAAW